MPETCTRRNASLAFRAFNSAEILELKMQLFLRASHPARAPLTLNDTIMSKATAGSEKQVHGQTDPVRTLSQWVIIVSDASVRRNY